MGIGITLQQLITARSTNVNAVATATGVSPQTLYSIIKRDNMKTDLGDLYKIAHHLGVNLEYFYAGYSEEKKSPAPDSPEAEDEDQAVDDLGTPRSAYNLFYKLLIERGYLEEGKDFTPSQARFFASLLEVVNAVYPAPAIQVEADNVG